MAKPITSAFHQFVLEVEFVPGSGSYTRVCGLNGRGINRQHNMSTTEVPADCDDESLPAVIERAVQSSEVTVSGTGVWSAQSHENLLDWWYAGQTRNVRVQHVLANVGDTEYETGPAYLVTFPENAERGQKVTAEIAIEFDGLPTRTPKAA